MMQIKRVTAALYIMPALVLVDWINGLVGQNFGLESLPVSPGELARGFVFVLAFLLLLLHAQREIRGSLGLAILIGASLSLGFVKGVASGGGLGEADKVFKVMYGPVIAGAYLILFGRYGVSRNAVLGSETVMGAIAGLSIALFQVLGVGHATYGEAAYSTGLFSAQNDIGLTMSLTLFCGVELLLSQPKVWWGVTCACTIAGMLTVGTRTGTLASFAVPVAVLWIHRDEMRSRRRAPVMVGLILLMVAGLGLAGIRQYDLITSQNYQVNKYESLANGEMPRAFLLAGGLRYVVHRPLASDITGDGSVTYMKGVSKALDLGQTKRITEIDWMDLFGMYGLLGLAAVYAFYLWFYTRVWRLRRFANRQLFWLAFGILSFYLLHATIAGHALASPLPEGAMAPLLGFIWLIDRRGKQAPLPRRLARVAAAVDHDAG